jgi:hypothetical protein
MPSAGATWPFSERVRAPSMSAMAVVRSALQ